MLKLWHRVKENTEISNMNYHLLKVDTAIMTFRPVPSAYSLIEIIFNELNHKEMKS
jgi:hypothetical protein